MLPCPRGVSPLATDFLDHCVKGERAVPCSSWLRVPGQQCVMLLFCLSSCVGAVTAAGRPAVHPIMCICLRNRRMVLPCLAQLPLLVSGLPP